MFFHFCDDSAVHGPGAVHARRHFSNGWEVSVVRHNGSYGWPNLYELGVFIYSNRDMRGRRGGWEWMEKTLRYRDLAGAGLVSLPHISSYDEIAGWLTLRECEQIARKVAGLPCVGTLLRRWRRR